MFTPVAGLISLQNWRSTRQQSQDCSSSATSIMADEAGPSNSVGGGGGSDQQAAGAEFLTPQQVAEAQQAAADAAAFAHRLARTPSRTRRQVPDAPHDETEVCSVFMALATAFRSRHAAAASSFMMMTWRTWCSWPQFAGCSTHLFSHCSLCFPGGY